jgi:sucrose phosphorylase
VEQRRNGVHLLAYPDRLGGGLAGLRRLLTEGPLAVFAGVHILPFFTPYDGADAGFDPVDHATVDPRLGDWSDVVAMREAGLEVTADVIVNHVSADSAQFRDWLARGAASPYAGMFLTFDTVFPDGGTEAGITAFYRPRAGLPFTPYQMADGTRRLVWTTFMPSQVDLDVAHPVARDYLTRVMRTLAEGGVRTVRLDAVGYAVKTAGTDSFMTDQTLDFVREVTALAHAEGLEVLVEVHAHHSQQRAVAEVTDLVYDFALPPLLLHALETGTADRLAAWLRIRPANAITVLDTHDGIGVIDAGPAREWPGLMDHDEMAMVFEGAARRTNGESARASTPVAWAALPHQVNSTFYSVLGEDDDAYLLARAVQLFTPGRPQVYYVGLLAGRNDLRLFEETGVGREINRHRFTATEIDAALERPVVRAQLDLIRLRGSHPAFDGTFTARQESEGVLVLTWTHGEHRAELRADLAGRTHVLTATDPAGA